MNKFEIDIVEVIKEMIRVFRHNKRTKIISDRVSRGRAKSASAEFEEQTAKLIEAYTPRKFSIAIDSPFSFPKKKSERVKTIYPDIAILNENNNEIVGFIECKIDLGYLPRDWVKKHMDMIYKVKRSRGFKYNGKSYTVSRSFQSAGIVLTASNHPERIPEFVNGIENPVIILERNRMHPNEDKIQPLRYIRDLGSSEERREWRKLHKLIKSFR